MLLALELATYAPSPAQPASEPLSCAQETAEADRTNPPIPTSGYPKWEKLKLHPLGGGGFTLFFQRLDCEIRTGGFGRPVEVYFYGHSMGAFVGDEAIWRYPDMPWRRIVYMGAANSTRDFRTSVAPLLECSALDDGKTQQCMGRDTRFYNLMLHPLAEARELNTGGIAPQGSMLEWIDEMLANPRTLEERTFGKWLNVEQTLPLLPPEARRRMTLRVFPRQQDMRYGDATERQRFFAECAPAPGLAFREQTPSGGPEGFDGSIRCHPVKHGEFPGFSFWREDYLKGAPETSAGR
jgi:pimeloyl-ACP methyl ester carboxylesterase